MAYDQDYALPRTGAPTREEERVSAQTLFGQVMGLVAITCAFAALGAYIGRDLSGAVGFGSFVGALGCTFGIRYALLGLVLFGFYTIFDFNRLKRASDMRVAPALAASIFLDIFNIFLFMLSLLGGGRR